MQPVGKKDLDYAARAARKRSLDNNSMKYEAESSEEDGDGEESDAEPKSGSGHDDISLGDSPLPGDVPPAGSEADEDVDEKDKVDWPDVTPSLVREEEDAGEDGGRGADDNAGTFLTQSPEVEAEADAHAVDAGAKKEEVDVEHEANSDENLD